MVAKLVSEEHFPIGFNHRDGDSDGDGNDTPSASNRFKLEDILYYVIRARIDGGDNINDNGLQEQKQEEEDLRDMLDDCMDMMTSFLLENIEYVIDAIDGASHFLKRWDINSIRSCKEDNTAHDDYTGYGYGGAQDSNNMEDMNVIHRTVKDVIHLSSLVVGIMELFRGDLGVPWTMSIASRTEDLLGAFANFVALYCTHSFLVGVEEVGGRGASTTIASSEKVLFQLYSCVHIVDNACRGDSSRNLASYQCSIEGGGKRRRIGNDSGKVAQCLDFAAIIAMLRMFHSSRNELGRNKDFTKSLLDNELINVKSYIMEAFRNRQVKIANDGCNGDDNYGTGKEFAYHAGQKRAAYEASNIIQACALSDLVLPRGMDPRGENYDLAMLSSLVSPLFNIDHSTPNEGNISHQVSSSKLLIPINPWNALVARKLSLILQVTDGPAEHEGLPIKVVSTDSTSTSSVSDLRSDSTSTGCERSGELDVVHNSGDEQCLIHRKLLDAYMTSIPPLLNMD
uniref:Uncharacterized protein n=1 Tax=Chaetoceros debilis TaxID=122233 RepID=A0A7S3V8Q7_9STRA